jgi:hypothetical protein
MSDLRSVFNVDERLAIGNKCLTKATLNGTGAVATVTTTGTNTYTVDGIFRTFAAWTTQSVAITHTAAGLPVSLQAAYVQPVLTTVYYVMALNAAGTVACIQGSFAGQQVAAIPGVAEAYTASGGLPIVPAGYTPIGLFKVVLTGAATFTPATTLWNAAGVTATFFDVTVLPSVAP